MSNPTPIPIGISNRHIHLSEADYQTLFPNTEVSVRNWLKQPGVFAADQLVTLVGPKGQIERVRLLAPFRKETQVEVSLTDARALGINVPIAMSGDLSKASDITVKTEEGEIVVKGAIAAKRHIHMNPEEATSLNVVDHEEVQVSLGSDDRRTIYDDVIVRVSLDFVLEMHIDTDEANAAGITPQSTGIIIKKNK